MYHVLIALDVSRCLEPRAFQVEVQRHLDDLRGSARLPGVARDEGGAAFRAAARAA